jgi:cytochrome c peroxidase
MHDGTFESLEEVLTHYARGGAGHYLQDQAIVPFELSPKENKQLLDFLRSLTDLSFLERL